MSEIWSKMCIGLHVKYPLFLSDFNETWIFSAYFRKILKYQILCKFCQWESTCSVRTDRRTDGRTDRHGKANSRFSQFCELAYKCSLRGTHWGLTISFLIEKDFILFGVQTEAEGAAEQRASLELGLFSCITYSGGRNVSASNIEHDRSMFKDYRL